MKYYEQMDCKLMSNKEIIDFLSIKFINGNPEPTTYVIENLLIIIDELKTRKIKKNGLNIEGKTRELLERFLGFSKTTAKKYIKLIKEGDVDLKQKFNSGNISINNAYDILMGEKQPLEKSKSKLRKLEKLNYPFVYYIIDYKNIDDERLLNDFYLISKIFYKHTPEITMGLIENYMKIFDEAKERKLTNSNNIKYKGKMRNQLKHVFGYSETTNKKIIKIIKEGSKKIKSEIDNGNITINHAYNILMGDSKWIYPYYESNQIEKQLDENEKAILIQINQLYPKEILYLYNLKTKKITYKCEVTESDIIINEKRNTINFIDEAIKTHQESFVEIVPILKFNHNNITDDEFNIFKYELSELNKPILISNNEKQKKIIYEIELDSTNIKYNKNCGKSIINDKSKKRKICDLKEVKSQTIAAYCKEYDDLSSLTDEELRDRETTKNKINYQRRIRHQGIVQILAVKLEEQKLKIYENKYIDCATVKNDNIYIFEIKTLDGSLKDEDNQVGEALYQLLKYSKFNIPSKFNNYNIKKIALFESKVKDEYIELLDENNIKVLWMDSDKIFNDKYGKYNFSSLGEKTDDI